MAAKHGGARPGAGRKKKADKYKAPIAAAEDRCRDRLHATIKNLEFLADGGYERHAEKWEPAGTILIEAPLRDATGEPIIGMGGKPVLVKQLAFPDKPADELVLVSRTREVAEPDRVANIYLADRVMGKPRQALEHTGEDGGPLKIIVEYADADPDVAPAPAPPGAGADPPGDAPV